MKTKKFIALLLAILMVVGLLPTFALAAAEESTGTWNEEKNGVYKLTSMSLVYADTAADLPALPEAIGPLNATTAADSVFAGLTKSAPEEFINAQIPFELLAREVATKLNAASGAKYLYIKQTNANGLGADTEGADAAAVTGDAEPAWWTFSTGTDGVKYGVYNTDALSDDVFDILVKTVTEAASTVELVMYVSATKPTTVDSASIFDSTVEDVVTLTLNIPKMSTKEAIYAATEAALAESPSYGTLAYALENGAYVAPDKTVELTDVTVPAGTTLIIPTKQTLTEDGSVTVNGTLNLVDGAEAIKGEIAVNAGGTLLLGGTDADDNPTSTTLIGADQADTGAPYLLLTAGKITIAADANAETGDTELTVTLTKADGQNGADGAASVPAGNYFATAIGETPFTFVIDEDAALTVNSNNQVTTEDAPNLHYAGLTVAADSALENNGTLTVAAGGTLYIAEDGEYDGDGTLSIAGKAYLGDEVGLTVDTFTGELYVTDTEGDITIDGNKKAVTAETKFGDVEFTNVYTPASGYTFSIATDTATTAKNSLWWGNAVEGYTTTEDTAKVKADSSISYGGSAELAGKYKVTGTSTWQTSTKHKAENPAVGNFLALVAQLPDGSALKETTLGMYLGKVSAGAPGNFANSGNDNTDFFGMQIRLNDMVAVPVEEHDDPEDADITEGLADGQFLVAIGEEDDSSNASVYLFDTSAMTYEHAVAIKVKSGSDFITPAGGVTLGGETAELSGQVYTATVGLTSADQTFTVAVSGYDVTGIAYTEGFTNAAYAAGDLSGTNGIKVHKYNNVMPEITVTVASKDAASIGNPTFAVLTGNTVPITSAKASTLIKDGATLTPAAPSDGGTVAVTGTVLQKTYGTEFSSNSALQEGHYLPLSITMSELPASISAKLGDVVVYIYGSELKHVSGTAFFSDGDVSKGQYICYLTARLEAIREKNGTGVKAANKLALYFDWDGSTKTTPYDDIDALLEGISGIEKSYIIDVSKVADAGKVALTATGTEISTGVTYGTYLNSWSLDTESTTLSAEYGAGETVLVYPALKDGFTITSVTYKYTDTNGDDQEKTATATTVTISGDPDTTKEAYTFKMPADADGDVTVEAAFDVQSYPIDVASSLGGSISIKSVEAASEDATFAYDASAGTVKYATSQNIVITLNVNPKTGYALSNAADGTGVEGEANDDLKSAYFVVYPYDEEGARGSKLTGTVDGEAMTITFTKDQLSASTAAYGIIIVPHFEKETYMFAAGTAATDGAVVVVQKTANFGSTDATASAPATDATESDDIKAAYGDTLYIGVKAADGYQLTGTPSVDGATVTDVTTEDGTTKGSFDAVYSFTMPQPALDTSGGAAEGARQRVTVTQAATPIDYAITYDLSGGTGRNPATYNLTNKTDKIVLTDPTRTNYTFKGWSTTINVTGSSTASGYAIAKDSTNDNKWTLTITANDDALVHITLTAEWTSDDDTLKTVIVNDGKNDLTATKETADDGTVSYSVLVPADASSVTVKATPNNSAAVAQVDDGSAGGAGAEATQTVTLSGKATESKINVKSETDSSGDGTDYKLTITKADPDTYPVKVAYDTSSSSSTLGTITVDPSMAAAGDKITVTVTPKTGYKLTKLVATAGSNDDATITDTLEYTVPSSGMSATSSITITATFAAIEYKITYALAGGTNNAKNTTTKYTVADSDFTLYNPSFSGYNFLGWTEAGDANTTYIDVGDADAGVTYTLDTSAPKDLTFTAKWQIKSTDAGVNLESSSMKYNGDDYAAAGVNGGKLLFPAPDTDGKKPTSFTVVASGEGATITLADGTVIEGTKTENATATGLKDGDQITVKSASLTRTSTYTVSWVPVYSLTSDDAKITIGVYEDGLNAWEYLVKDDTAYFAKTENSAKFTVSGGDVAVTEMSVKSGTITDPVYNDAGYYAATISTDAVLKFESIEATVAPITSAIDEEAAEAVDAVIEAAKANGASQELKDQAANLEAITSGSVALETSTASAKEFTDQAEELLGSQDSAFTQAINENTIARAMSKAEDDRIADALAEAAKEDSTVSVEVTEIIATPTFEIKPLTDETTADQIKVTITPVVILTPVVTITDSEAGTTTEIKATEAATTKTVTITTAVDMTIPLSNALAKNGSAVRETLNVKHEKTDSNGRTTATYFYSGQVKGSDNSYYLFFKNPHGFSDFTLTATSAPVWNKSTEVGYNTLQEAVTQLVAEGGNQTLQINTTYKANDKATVTLDDAKYATTPLVFTVDVSKDEDSHFAQGNITGTATVDGYKVALTVTNNTESNSTYIYSFSLEAAATTETPATDTGTGGTGGGLGGGGGAGGGGGGATTKPEDETKPPEDTTPSTPTLGDTPFTDVPASFSYAYDAIEWAYENGVTLGTGATSFSPAANCTRAQFVTFLWRAAGSPAPASSENSFTDVSATAQADYYQAILWAVEQGITLGTNAEGTLFSPNQTVTRAQAVTFMARYDGGDTSGDNSFNDVADGSWYEGAVDWAVANGITNGTGNGNFSPNLGCNRAMMVTFLFRLFTDATA